jgi:hypothetical protein
MERERELRLRSFIVIAIAALAVSLGTGVSAAVSATAAPVSAAGGARSAVPDNNGDCTLVTPPVSGNYLELWNGYNYTADEWLCGCDPGTTYHNVLTSIKSFINNCGTKAWLQYSNGSSYCISPLEIKAHVGLGYQDPVSEYVGRETGNC